MINELGITLVTYEFIKNPIEEERRRVAAFIQSTFRTSVNAVIEYMAEKEGKKGDP
jgi:hypothetical protein